MCRHVLPCCCVREHTIAPPRVSSSCHSLQCCAAAYGMERVFGAGKRPNTSLSCSASPNRTALTPLTAVGVASLWLTTPHSTAAAADWTRHTHASRQHWLRLCVAIPRWSDSLWCRSLKLRAASLVPTPEDPVGAERARADEGIALRRA